MMTRMTTGILSRTSSGRRDVGGRPSRDGRNIGAQIPGDLKKLALADLGKPGFRTQTAVLEAVIARGLEVERRRRGLLPLVRVKSESTGRVRVNLPPDLWEKFRVYDETEMSLTDRLVTLLYHGLGLHHAKSEKLLRAG